MKYFAPLFFLVSLTVEPNARDTTDRVVKLHAADSLDRIIIVNAFDAMAMDSRKRKMELFRELSDTLKHFLASEIRSRASMDIYVIPGLIKEAAGSDSIVFSLMSIHSAAKAIVIKGLEVYFDQTGVEVTKEGSSKSRTASYDLCSHIIYALYNKSSKIHELPYDFREFFGERKVISGLLAAGPDIVGKSKHARKSVEKNAAGYVLNFITGLIAQ